MYAVRLDPLNGIRAVIVRPQTASGPRIFVLTRIGLRPLLQLGPEDALGVKLGPLVHLQHRDNAGNLAPFSLDEPEDEFWRATCDPVSGLVYLSTKSRLFTLNLDEDNVLTQLAGEAGDEDVLDGPGVEARVERPFCMVADGHGSLLIKDCGSSFVRRVLLPPPGSPPTAWSPSVSCLPHEYHDNVWALALDYSEPQRMYVATKTAIYRHDTLPYDPSPAAVAAATAAAMAAAGAAAAPAQAAGAAGVAGAAGAAEAAPAAGAAVAAAAAAAAAAPLGAAVPPPSASASNAPSRPSTPVLLAGVEDGTEQLDGLVAVDDDGTGVPAPSTARFCHIMCMLVDSNGRLFVAERAHEEACIRVVLPCGLVTTFAAGFDVDGSEYELSILPYGWLAVHAWDDSRLHLLHVGPRLAPSAPAPRSPSAADGGGCGGFAAGRGADVPPGRPGLAGLAADLGALLDAPPDVSCADVEVVVGDRSFPCHRAVLGARCEYFRGRFASGLADSAGSKIELPDADPAAFALLRRYLYTSSLDIPPALLRPTLELADRLLLHAAADVASAQLLAAVTPGSVVSELLWAEPRSFPSLLAGLKAYYLDNAHRVLEEAPGSLEELMTASPKLHLELYAAGIKRARRR